MPAGTYFVRVVSIVSSTESYFVPLYQYQGGAYIYINQWYTPTITNISPDTNLPNSFVTIAGDFMVCICEN